MKRILCLLIVFGIVGIIPCYLNDRTTTASEKTVTIDHVCGMEVNKDKAIKLEHNGKAYYFCSKMCADAFKKDPKKYLKEEKKLLEEKKK